MESSYPDLPTAAQGILCEAVQITAALDRPFVVIGGWSPYLLNPGAITHPGTRDVDLLFRHAATKGELEDVFQTFLERGYFSSAKHHFQLLRVVDVGGREFVFNIDLLHATNLGKPPDMFVDHLVLDDGMLLYRYQSIVVPLSDLLFEEDGHTSHRVEGTIPSGERVLVTMPLMTELGTLLTKSKSMLGIKRDRDAFDVMLAICQARDPDWLADAIRQNSIQDRLQSLWSLLSDATLHSNIGKYWEGAKDVEAWDDVRVKIEGFLEDSGVDKPQDKCCSYQGGPAK